MKILFFFFFMFSQGVVYADDFNRADKLIDSEIIKWLGGSSDVKAVFSPKKYCFIKEITLTSLKICHKYLDAVYVTDEIDTYLAYVNQLLYFGVDVSNMGVYKRIINTQYDEVISQMYFDIAKSSYLHQRYKHALKYLKKIDDNLEDRYVYHALLIYGLIYFEYGEYKRAQKFFTRITKNSEHYASAQFNLGLINMRSLWWSDAEQNLNNAITSFDLKSLTPNNAIFLDKLYLTIAYSQLSRKDFRAAKKSFQTISIDSIFKSRALMGIALAEIGLNNLGRAASLLKLVKKTGVVSVQLDALVTLPQVYHKAGNIKQTIKYYDSAIEGMSALTKNAKINISSYEYSSIFSGYTRRIAIVESLIDTNSMSSQSNKLLGGIRSSLDNDKNKLLYEFNTKLDSKIINYINQSKYALAVIYDSSVVQN